MVDNAAKVLIAANSHVGLREEPRGSNDGPDLRRVLKATPFQPGESWCFYFALACLIEAFGGKEHIPSSVLFTGSCQLAAEHAAKLGKLSDASAIGSIFVLHNAAGHFHHAGIVCSKPYRDAVINTIEGNTNNNGSANGDGVYRRGRPLAMLKFIIW